MMGRVDYLGVKQRVDFHVVHLKHAALLPVSHNSLLGCRRLAPQPALLVAPLEGHLTGGSPCKGARLSKAWRSYGGMGEHAYPG